MSSICQAYPWLLCWCFDLVFGCLFAKVGLLPFSFFFADSPSSNSRIPLVFASAQKWRLHRIFQLDRKQFRTVKITDAAVLEKVVVLLAADTFVLALWTGLAPIGLRPTTPALTSSGELKYTHVCAGPDGNIYFGVLLAMKAVVLTGALYLAFVLRNIKSVFSESKAIFFSVYNLAIWLVLVLSLTQLIGDRNPTVSFLLVAGGVWVNMTVTLISMFAPKLLEVVRLMLQDLYLRCVKPDILLSCSDVEQERG
jgi:hypothetical protein